jgi:hypothetical protein
VRGGGRGIHLGTGLHGRHANELAHEWRVSGRQCWERGSAGAVEKRESKRGTGGGATIAASITRHLGRLQVQVSAVPSPRQIHITACLAKERVPPQTQAKAERGALSQRMPNKPAIHPSGWAAGTVLGGRCRGRWHSLCADVKGGQAWRDGRVGRSGPKRRSRAMPAGWSGHVQAFKKEVRAVHRSFRSTIVGCSESAAMHGAPGKSVRGQLD